MSKPYFNDCFTLGADLLLLYAVTGPLLATNLFSLTLLMGTFTGPLAKGNSLPWYYYNIFYDAFGFTLYCLSSYDEWHGSWFNLSDRVSCGMSNGILVCKLFIVVWVCVIYWVIYSYI